MDLTVADDRFWYLTHQGLWQWDQASGNATLLSNQASWFLVRYQPGQLWLSGNNRLYSYQLAEQQLRTYDIGPCDKPPCLDVRQILDLVPIAAWFMATDPQSVVSL